MTMITKDSHNSSFSKSDLYYTVSTSLSTADLHPVFSLEDVSNYNNCIVIPGLFDVHVHLREPGFSYKETIKSGTLACAHGGYTAVCSMPNLDPVPDCKDSLDVQLKLIEKDACIAVYPYGAITKGERGEQLSDMKDMASSVIAFSDDGRGVQSREMMKEAMLKAKSLGKMIVAHCEDNSLLCGGYIHKGKYAEKHGHRGISSESEWKQIERDLELVKETGCAYHVCHISTKESVGLIRRAKADGLNVSCETCPHYLVLCEDDMQEDARFKMNPPLRSAEDRAALIEGIKDGTIDMIVTDHAPHSAEEKSKGLEKSAMGVVGIETAFSVIYTYLVRPEIITLERAIELMAINPRRRFNVPLKNDEFTVFAPNEAYTVDSRNFFSMGRSTPFEGYKLYGKIKMTVIGGKTVWKEI